MMRYLILSLWLTSLVAGCSRAPGYYEYDGVWYWVEPTLDGYYTVRIDVADGEIEYLGNGIGRDRTRGYWKGDAIPGADGSSLQKIQGYGTGDVVYSVDRDGVFLRDWRLVGAVPDDFRVIGGLYAASSGRVYCGTYEMENVDGATFEVIQDFGTLESSIELVEARFGRPIDTPILGVAWARDKNRYYYGPVPVEDADYESFTVLDSYQARDRYGRFAGYLRAELEPAAIAAWKEKYRSPQAIARKRKQREAEERLGRQGASPTRPADPQYDASPQPRQFP